MLTLFVSILFVSLVFGGTVTQTDWSGGGGVQGPVSSWSDLFWTSGNIDFNQGELKLSLTPVSPIGHLVDGDFNGAYCVYAEDIDGDGDVDILGAAKGEDDISWWENSDSGSGIYWTEHIIGGNFRGTSVRCADIDGDGDYDIIGASEIDDDITWWENVDGTGTSWAECTVDGNYDGAFSVYSSDIDGDGDTDVLGAGSFANDITWWENSDSGSGIYWTEHTVNGSFNGAHSVCSADIDGDGDNDVIGAAISDSDIAWWQNIGGTGINWSKCTVDGDFGGAYSVCTTDMDGDGDADIIGAAYSDDDISWWENTDGIGVIWVEHLVDGSFYAPVSVYATDVDGDGDADILGAAFDGRDLTWWENKNGTGTSWTEHTVDGNCDEARSAYARDIDGDGSVDILGASEGYDSITWWDVIGYEPLGVIESSILDVGDIGEWNNFSSNVYTPYFSSVSYQFRSSENSSDMGAWSDTVFSSETPLQGILADSTRYLQYRVILETPSSSATPELYDVFFSYSLLLEIADIEDSWSLHASENPAQGFFSAIVTAPETGVIELSLYDVSGRVITKTSQEFVAGTHSVSFTGLATGVYFCTMQAEQFSATERIVVID